MEVRSSMGKRYEEMEEKSEERESELKSMEETWELLQETPVNKHGSVSFCQFWRILGFGRDDLKLNKFWASLVFAKTGEEREREQSRRGRSNVVMRRFILSCSLICCVVGLKVEFFWVLMGYWFSVRH